MNTQSVVQNKIAVLNKGSKINIPVADFRMLDIPGLDATTGIAYVKVVDIPDLLEKYIDVNPRVPSRTKKGTLSGPIVKSILETLAENPEQMAVKNQGIYVLVDSMEYTRGGRRSFLSLSLTDRSRHGIVNGGHTYAAIRQAVETFEGEQLARLERAYVKLNVIQGLPKSMVADIAEGLNRSKQVDDLSLLNLQGEFNIIRRVIKDLPGADKVAYFQGDSGSVYISELLVYLELLNTMRFDEYKQPNILYNKHSLGIKYFSQDMMEAPNYMKALVDKLPDVLWLVDSIKKLTPEAAKRNKFKFGLAKVDSEHRRAGTEGRKTELPFLGETMDYKVPNGWVYPILSAMRANLRLTKNGTMEWIVPIRELLPSIIDSLVAVCISEHKENLMKPELTGKKEGAYSKCYSKVQLYLARRGM